MKWVEKTKGVCVFTINNVLMWYSSAIDSGIRFVTRPMGEYRTVVMLTMFLWGFWIASPWWSSFSVTPTFSLMQKIAGEEVWGLCFMLVPAAALLCRVTGNKAVEQVFALLAASGWVAVACVCAYSNPYSTATVVYPSLALMALVDWKVHEDRSV